MKLTKRDVDDVFRLDFGSGIAPIFLSEEEMDELRAYLRAERDEELGRWRDPENPNEVVYPDNGLAIRVVDEADGERAWWTRGNAMDPSYSSDLGFDTARAYFAAHPEPKPWDTAQPDEVWALTINNDREEVFRCGERGLYQLKTGNSLGSMLSCVHNKITDGHRIWPEEDK